VIETIEAHWNGYTGIAYGQRSFSLRKDGKEIFHTAFCNKRPTTEEECIQMIKDSIHLLEVLREK
jgi:hypothetical protein